MCIDQKCSFFIPNYIYFFLIFWQCFKIHKYFLIKKNYLPLIHRDETVKHFHANVLEFLSKLVTIYISYPSIFHDDPTNYFHEKFSSPESKQTADIRKKSLFLKNVVHIIILISRKWQRTYVHTFCSYLNLNLILNPSLTMCVLLKSICCFSEYISNVSVTL